MLIVPTQVCLSDSMGVLDKAEQSQHRRDSVQCTFSRATVAGYTFSGPYLPRRGSDMAPAVLQL